MGGRSGYRKGRKKNGSGSGGSSSGSAREDAARRRGSSQSPRKSIYNHGFDEYNKMK